MGWQQSHEVCHGEVQSILNLGGSDPRYQDGLGAPSWEVALQQRDLGGLKIQFFRLKKKKTTNTRPPKPITSVVDKS